MNLKTIHTIYVIYGILLIIFIFQELFPVLFILPTAPGTYLVLMNFPLTIGIILLLVPIFTSRNFLKTTRQEHEFFGLIRVFLLVLIISAFCAYIIPYLTFEGIVTEIGFRYSAYSGLFGLILVIFGYLQLTINRVYFGFLIGTAGSAMGVSNHIKIFVYALQQYNIRFEIGFYIGLISWIILCVLNLRYLLKSNNSIQIK